MDKLIQITDGVFILHLICIILVIIAIIMTMITYFRNIKKLSIKKKKKIEFIVVAISLIIICIFIGCFCGYYFAIYKFC